MLRFLFDNVTRTLALIRRHALRKVMGDVPHFVRVFRDNPDETKFDFSITSSGRAGKHSNWKPIGDNQFEAFIAAAVEHGNVQILEVS